MGRPNNGPAPSVATKGWVSFRLGTVAFGGLGASLALLEREMVAHRGWLTETDLRDALLPRHLDAAHRMKFGPTVVSINHVTPAHLHMLAGLR